MTNVFLAEAWTWYTICMLFVAARFTARRLFLRSWKRLQADDWVMLFAILPYTTMMVSLTYVDRLGSNVIPPEDFSDIDPLEVPNLETGAKFAMVADTCANTTTWLMKGCILILYGRIMTQPKQRIILYFITAYVVLGYIIMEAMFFAYWCTTIENNWIIPPPTFDCATYFHHILVNSVLNISSDVMILAFILPVVFRLHLPLKKKIIICGIFSLGVFTLIATILNRVYNLRDPYGDSWVAWYLREPSTAVLVANMPMMWPLVQRIFHIGSFMSETRGSGLRSGPHTGPSSHSRSFGSRRADTSGTWVSLREPGKDEVPYETTTNIVTGKQERHLSGDMGQAMPLEIWQQREIIVQNEITPTVGPGTRPKNESNGLQSYF